MSEAPLYDEKLRRPLQEPYTSAESNRCRANVAHMSRSRPEFDVGFQLQCFETLQILDLIARKRAAHPIQLMPSCWYLRRSASIITAINIRKYAAYVVPTSDCKHLCSDSLATFVDGQWFNKELFEMGGHPIQLMPSCWYLRRSASIPTMIFPAYVVAASICKHLNIFVCT